MACSFSSALVSARDALDAILTAWNSRQSRTIRQGEVRADQTANVIKEKRNENQTDQVYVDDQEKAMRFYTGCWRFVKKSRFQSGTIPLASTVGSADEPNGTGACNWRN